MPKPSPELAKIIGEGDTTAEAAIAAVTDYVRLHGLHVPGSESFKVDDPLGGVFGPGPVIGFLEAAKRLSFHLGLAGDHHGLAKLELSDADGTIETPWAEPLGGNRYRLMNIPFFAYRFSEGDVVEAEPQPEGFPSVKRVVEKSGNRTVRIFFERGATTLPARKLLGDLRALGCSWENADSKLICVTVPPAASLDRVAGFLTAARVTWEYADPKYEDLFPED